MFTGIIRATSTIAHQTMHNESLILEIKKPTGWNVRIGDSVAVNGVCLTIAARNTRTFTTQLMPETLSKTTFGKVNRKQVNLERPLKLSDRVDGHFVTGHVDAVGTVTGVKRIGQSAEVTIAFPKVFKKYMVTKGSITVDGVSLTVVRIQKNTFTVSLVRYTLDHTIAHAYARGDVVNLEFDLLGKYALLKK